MSLRLLGPIILALLVLASPLAVEGKGPCQAPDAVCAAASRVFRIASFDPLASAVLIGPGLFVTNRHAVADVKAFEIFIPPHRPMTARVVPTTDRKLICKILISSIALVAVVSTDRSLPPTS